MTFHEGIDWVLVEKLLFGLAIGGLIGLERERHRDRRKVYAGVRTYPLIALTGVLLDEISRRTGEPLFLALGVALAGTFAVLLFWVRHERGETGFTSPFAMIVTFLIGFLVGQGRLIEAVVAGVATTVLLFTRERLHTMADAMTEKEMRGALYFVVIAFILFPLSPDQPVDPWGILNPRQVLLIVILVSAISFAGFLAMRFWGVRRGLPMSGLFGGLVNSEAATTASGNVSHNHPGIRSLALQAVLLAIAAMFVRNLAIAVAVDPSLDLAAWLALPLLGAAAVPAIWSRLKGGHVDEDETPQSIRLPSPFAIKPAVIFAGLFVAISGLAYLLQQIPGLGPAGVYLTAFGGLINAGAVVATMATLAASGQVPIHVAGATAAAAALLSALNKPVVARAADPPLAKQVWPAVAATLVVGGVLLIAVLVLP